VLIVVYTSRAKSPADAQTVCTLFSQEWALKLKPGYIRGNCAIKVDDPCAVIGVIYWGTGAAMDAVSATDEARRAEVTYLQYLVEPSAISVYEVW
jgi:hypothetical protein